MALDYSEWAATPEELDLFHKAPFDHAGARAKLVAKITRTMKQLNGEKVASQGGKDFEPLHNNGVRYLPTLNGVHIDLPGQGDEDGFQTTRSKLISMLPEFAKHVEAGEFDDQLEAAMTSKGLPASFYKLPTNNKSTPRTRRSSTGLGATARPDDREWMEKFTAKYGPAPSPDHVPNTKGTRWATRAAVERGKKSKGL